MPQIELMQADLPHVLYTRTDEGAKKNGSEPDRKELEKVWRMQEEANRRYEERKAARQRKEGYTVAELFRGDAEK